MTIYVAHYKSPRNENPVSGTVEFESENRAGSKRNMHDARMEMLSRFGSEAVSWNIDKVETKKSRGSEADGQMQLDFREPTTPRKRRPSIKRGL